MAKRPVGKRRAIVSTPYEAVPDRNTTTVRPPTVDVEPTTAIAGAVAEPAPAKRESWRRRSATGAILTGFAMGLQEVFEPERKEPAIVMETSGDPPRDLPVEAELEVATTRRSVVRVRPWLLDEIPSSGSDEAAGGPAGESSDGDG